MRVNSSTTAIFLVVCMGTCLSFEEPSKTVPVVSAARIYTPSADAYNEMAVFAAKNSTLHEAEHNNSESREAFPKSLLDGPSGSFEIITLDPSHATVEVDAQWRKIMLNEDNSRDSDSFASFGGNEGPGGKNNGTHREETSSGNRLEPINVQMAVIAVAFNYLLIFQ